MITDIFYIVTFLIGLLGMYACVRITIAVWNDLVMGIKHVNQKLNNEEDQ